VGAATNGQKAVEMVQELRPSLAVLDIKMPKMSGIEAARAITAIEPLPIILVTGHSSEENAEEAIDAGVFSYLVKPITKKHLLPAIKLALARYEEFTELKDEVDDLKTALEARKMIERAKGILMKRCKIDEDAAYRLLQTQSQKENKKMREIAEMVVSASKLI
jgi:response regulator NasT